MQKDTEEELQQQMEEQPENVSLAGRRLLLAEDNGLNAEIAMTILQDADVGGRACCGWEDCG
ncbi:MAG: hypothetical protein ACLTTJ_14275 [Blautia sp.]